MAMVRVRHASMFIETKKVAECYKSDGEISSGDELQYGDDGVVGVSDGAASTQFDFDMIVPVGGASVNPEVMLVNKQFVDIQYGIANGKIWSATMRFTKAKNSSDAKAGTQIGSYTMIGGPPTIT